MHVYASRKKCIGIELRSRLLQALIEKVIQLWRGAVKTILELFHVLVSFNNVVGPAADVKSANLRGGFWRFGRLHKWRLSDNLFNNPDGPVAYPGVIQLQLTQTIDKAIY